MTDADGVKQEAFVDKWPRESQTPIVERYHTEIRKLVAERFAATGKTWEEAVNDPDVLKSAPLTRPVRRLDEVKAAKHPVVRYPFEPEAEEARIEAG